MSDTFDHYGDAMGFMLDAERGGYHSDYEPWYPGVYAAPHVNLRCNNCGMAGFRWHHTGARWALLGKDNSIHVCNKPNADDFEDLS